MAHDLRDGHELGHGKDKPVFWMVHQGLLTLGVTFNWCFMNLNQMFEAVAGTRSRSLFVHSDVGGSSVVGNQVTDLLREVNFCCKEERVQYFEPLHIQYIPLRKQVLDTIGDASGRGHM